jgi:hypothetical protein
MEHDVERVVADTKEHIRRAQGHESEPLPVEGYDRVTLKPEAVLMCARIVHAVIAAIDEEALSFESSRESLIAGIERVLERPDETPEENHQAWMEYRAAEGWVYGPFKDEARKTHPCMVPYDQLDRLDKSKDAIFLAVVRTFFGVGEQEHEHDSNL